MFKRSSAACDGLMEKRWSVIIRHTIATRHPIATRNPSISSSQSRNSLSCRIHLKCNGNLFFCCSVQLTWDSDSRFFTYLDGWAPDVPGLDDARLKFIATLNGTDSLVAEHKLSDFPNIVVRKDHKYGGPLKPGRVELIGDGFIPGMFVKTGNYTFRAESWLPDRRLLFCFKASLFLKGDL